MPPVASKVPASVLNTESTILELKNIINQRPIAIRSFTEEDLHAVTPNDLLLQRTRNTVPGVVYADNDNFTKRQQVMQELESVWWTMWIRQAIPHLVPYRKWKVEHRSLQKGDIVAVHYGKSFGKGEYRLGRVLQTHPDSHNVVRTVTVGARGKDRSAKDLTYVPKALEEHCLGVQRLSVICPIEEQTHLAEAESSVDPGPVAVSLAPDQDVGSIDVG